MKKKTQTKKNIGSFSHMLARLWVFVCGLNILAKLKKILFFSVFLFVFFPYSSFAWQEEIYDINTGDYTYEHKQNNDNAINVDFGLSYVNGQPFSTYGFVYKHNQQNPVNISSIEIPFCKKVNSDFIVRVYSEFSYGAYGYVPDENRLLKTFNQFTAPVDCNTWNGEKASFTNLIPLQANPATNYLFIITEVAVPLYNLGQSYVLPIKWTASEGVYNHNGYDTYGTGYILAFRYEDWIPANLLYPFPLIDQNGNTNYDFPSVTSRYYFDFKLSSSMPQLPPVNGICGAEHFYCIQGISTSYPNASTTAWIWTCDGENGGTTAQCFELFSPTSTATTTYPTYTDEDCNITSGNGILGCLKNAFYWAVIPSQSVFDKFNGLIDILKKKAPMGYFTAYYDAFVFNPSSTPAILVLVSETSPLRTYIFNPLRDILVIIIFVFGAVWLFRRVKNINI